jgi:hypothetical protein
MTPTQYLKESGVGTSAEIIKMAREDKAGFETLKQWAIEEAAAKGITLEVPAAA